MTSATVYVPGTCGELAQGMLDGSHFLVSCPVDLFSAVSVEVTDEGRIIAPSDAPKAARALRAALSFFGLDRLGVRLTIDSPIPRSKGMGSSTADVAGAIYALALALGRDIAPRDVARLALSIEPTNSSLFLNLALFDHRQGRISEDLGPPVPAEVMVLDCGGEVDTVAYNRVDRTRMLRTLEPLASEALTLIREGQALGDIYLIGQGAIISARAHQKVLAKAPLESIISAAHEAGAAGVNVAHSGTVIGVLFPPDRPNKCLVAAHFQSLFPSMTVVGWHRLIGGGCHRVGAGTKAHI